MVLTKAHYNEELVRHCHKIEQNRGYPRRIPLHRIFRCDLSEVRLNEGSVLGDGEGGLISGCSPVLLANDARELVTELALLQQREYAYPWRRMSVSGGGKKSESWTDVTLELSIQGTAAPISATVGGCGGL